MKAETTAKAPEKDPVREMSTAEKLEHIQIELKAPKGQYNDYGKYNYRSCEDILEGVKPLLAKYRATLRLGDEIVQIGDRFYVKATASFINLDGAAADDINNSAYAREEDTKKGMDGSQITGTASSYARKYALNGLFLIDDTKDADTNAYKMQQGAKAPQRPAQQAPKQAPQPVQKVAEAPQNVPETNKSNKISDIDLKAVRARIKAAAAKGRVLEEPDLCNLFRISRLEDMSPDNLTHFNLMMNRAGV